MTKASPFISLSTDFGPGNKGIGVMKAVILGICPGAVIIDLAHDITGFGITEGARLFEAIAYLPVGFHICVVDPGVGTARRAIAIRTKRGDVLIGPDNGVLRPATRFLGGIDTVYEITNETFMRLPVSPIFHGRDVFAPTAAHLASGKKIEEVGSALRDDHLTKAAYEEALFSEGKIEAEIVHANTFGSVFLNVMQDEMHKLASHHDKVKLAFQGKTLSVPYEKTFGDVPLGEDVILDDDFGRVEVAVNQSNFAERYSLKPGDHMRITR